MIIEVASMSDIPKVYKETILKSKEANPFSLYLSFIESWFIDINNNNPRAYAGAYKFGCRSLVLGPDYVATEFRGIGIHRQLIQARERFAARWGYLELLCYTAISNTTSANNFIREGFTLCKPWDKSLDKVNYLYFRKQL